MHTVVHAGFHKTGTTSLQGFLADSASWLAERDVHYPAYGRVGHTGHHDLACAYANTRRTTGPNDLFLPERERFRHRLDPAVLAMDCVSDQPSDTGLRVFSSEIISTYDCEELSRLIDALEGKPRFLLYYRGGVDFLYSCWATKVRWGSIDSFREFVVATLALDPRTPIAGMLAFVSLLVKIMGAVSVQRRSYEAAMRHTRGLLGDFAQHVLRCDLPPAPVRERRNATPQPPLIELTRAITHRLQDDSMHVHATLKVLRIRNARAMELIDMLCRAIAPLMRPLRLCELDPHGQALDEQGRPRAALGGPDLLPGWTFAPEQTSWYAETDALLGEMGQLPEFVELLSLVTNHPGVQPKP